jgi:ABC-2 type transport system permease protein
MIGTIARNELTQAARDRRVALSAVLVLVLLVASLCVGFQQRAILSRHVASGSEETYRHWANQGAVNPHAAAHWGMYAFKPAPPLLLFDPGVSAYTGVAIWLEAHRQNFFQMRPAQDASGLQRFGGFSAAWVMQTLGPLLLIIVGFGAFAGEREAGTLRQLLGSGVSPWRLLLGKSALLLGLVAFLVACVWGFLFLSIMSIGATSDDLARAAGIGAAYALYLAGFACLVIGVSAWSRTSLAAFLVLMAVWTFNVMVAPRLVDDLANRLARLPSAHQFAQDYGADMEQGYRDLLRKHFATDRWADIPPERFGDFLVLSEPMERRVAREHHDSLWDILLKQERLQSIAGFAFPLLAVRSVSAGLAGTDLLHWRDFSQAAENYRHLFESRVNTDVAANGGSQGYNYRANPKFWASVPPFEYHPPPARQAYYAAWPGGVSLVVFCVCCAVFAATGVARLRS